MNRAAGKCRTFEEVLVEQSAPTLARIKPANLFRYQPADLRAESTERALQKLPALERLLGTKGISVRVLKRCVRTDALLILVYRERALEGILSDAGNRRFLKRRGYSPELGLSGFLEESEFEPMFASLEGALGGKKVGLFGSYGWGDGQWMRDWVERCKNAGANVVGEGLILNGTPDADGEEECRAYGKSLC